MPKGYIITRVDQAKATITNSFLLTGTSEEDKHFVDEPIEITVAESQETKQA